MPGSHDYKVAVDAARELPADELLSAHDRHAPDDRRPAAGSPGAAQGRLFAHRDIFERSVSLLVALPRDRFNAELRQELQDLFMERFHGSSVDYHLALGETDPALRSTSASTSREGPIPDVAFAELEQEVIALARTWDDRLLERLVASTARNAGGRCRHAGRAGCRSTTSPRPGSRGPCSMSVSSSSSTPTPASSSRSRTNAAEQTRSRASCSTRPAGRANLSDADAGSRGARVDGRGGGSRPRCRGRRRRHLHSRLRRSRRRRERARRRRRRRPRCRRRSRPSGTADASRTASTAWSCSRA